MYTAVVCSRFVRRSSIGKLYALTFINPCAQNEVPSIIGKNTLLTLNEYVVDNCALIVVKLTV